MSVNVGWYRRNYGNQTITVDNRYSFDKGSYDGPFCANAPADANLPNGGGYQVCGLYDLKPAIVALNLPTDSTVTFSSNYGGETNIYKEEHRGLRSTCGRSLACFSRGASTRRSAPSTGAAWLTPAFSRTSSPPPRKPRNSLPTGRKPATRI